MSEVNLINLENGDFFNRSSKELAEYIIDFRRDLHKNPELSHKEFSTVKKVCSELDKHGIPYAMSGNNIIATVNGTSEGKTIGIRGDMDALPMDEVSDKDYKSTVSGVMHSCGHDGHTAVLLGVSILLNKIKEQLHGKVRLIFQSAEEVAGGVLEISEYLDANGGLDRLIALHVWADIESGLISCESGGRMAGGIFFDINVKGMGGHGSRPDKVKDPVKPACDILLKIASLPATRYNLLESCVVSPALIQAGTTFNIIPDNARVAGTIRHFSYEAGEKLSSLIEEVATYTAKSYGVRADVVFSGHVSPVVNAVEAAELGKEVIKKIDGLESFPFEPICACDCFGDLLKKYPGVYCYLGIRNEAKGIIYPQHHCQYDIDEDVLSKGCAYLSQYAFDFLNQ